MYQKEEIIEGLGKSGKAVIQWVEEQAPEKFAKGPEGKWETSQHIGHLSSSAEQLNTALKAPKMILKMQFGTPNRPGRTYDEVVKRYKEKLAANDMSKNPFAGKKLSIEEKADALKKLDTEVGKMQKALAKWKEEDLDKYLVPHPLLGKLTIREVMMWCVYHQYHHLKTLEDSYA